MTLIGLDKSARRGELKNYIGIALYKPEEHPGLIVETDIGSKHSFINR